MSVKKKQSHLCKIDKRQLHNHIYHDITLVSIDIFNVGSEYSIRNYRCLIAEKEQKFHCKSNGVRSLVRIEINNQKNE